MLSDAVRLGAVCLCLIGASITASSGWYEEEPVSDPIEAIRWLETHARQLVRQCRRELPDGRAVFPPQAGPGYEAFWLRDYAYMLEGAGDAFTPQELRDSLEFFLAAQRADGVCVDCVTFDGRPVFKPGMGSMGENPVADGSQFMVDLAFHTWKGLGQSLPLEHILPRLEKALEAVPRDPATGLVWIDPEKEWDRCPYGFTDTVVKKGAELFCSLLLYQSYRQMAEMEGAAGRASWASSYSERADRLADQIRNTFWDEKIGLFLAATHRCRQPDIWGSAFAVYLGVASPQQSVRIGEYFRDHYGQIVQAGKIRHLPGGEHWELCRTPPEQYQNGGFWGVATGWFVVALDTVDPELARRTIVDYVRDCQRRGFPEWVNGQTLRLPMYVASATTPLPGFRRVLRLVEEQ